jgi:hypothetical protein
LSKVRSLWIPVPNFLTALRLCFLDAQGAQLGPRSSPPLSTSRSGQATIAWKALPDQPVPVKARASRARLRRLDGLDRHRLVRRFDRHALKAQRERYAAPPLKGLGVVANKFAPFSRRSLRAAGTPCLIIKNLD